MNEQQARRIAEESVERADTIGRLIGGDLMVGLDLEGKFWVACNDETVNCLTEQEAIDIIVENLTGGEE